MSDAHVRAEPLFVRTVRAYLLLTASIFVRMLRESLVLRSMIWPGLVTSTTLAATLVVILTVRAGRSVALSHDIEPELRLALQEADFDLYEEEDPGASVRAGRYPLGTDGKTVFVYGSPPSSPELESIVRAHEGTWWRTVPTTLVEPKEADIQGDVACKILALLFVLYGLVFGLGGVARDRDDGTLEAELSLPVPRITGGFARWTASSIIIASFYGVSVLLFNALLPISEYLSIIRHGAAASSAGVAIGIVAVGTAGIKQGFSGPFAAGMTFATGLAIFGGSLGLDWLPIASLFAGGSGWLSLANALLIGVIASWVYGLRTGGR